MGRPVMQKIIYTRPDGGISIVRPSVHKTIEEVLAKAVPADATNVQVVDDSVFPADRKLRNAWVAYGKDIVEDKYRSQEVVRKARDHALSILDDRAFVEARKPDGDVAAIDAKAQVLRDMPQREVFNTTKNPETYKNMLDEIETIVKE
jgi:hypothetical protein